MTRPDGTPPPPAEAPRVTASEPRGPWSEFFAPATEVPRPGPPDPDDAAETDDADPEEGHPT